MKRAILLLCLSSLARLQAQDFPAQADAILSTTPFANAQVGAAFVSAPDAKPLYARNPDQLLLPASTAKLATSAAALAKLKPDYRFTTTFLINAKDQGKPKLSALVWRGTGDPSISGRGRSSIYEIFEVWAASLTALGVNKVKRLVIDDRCFQGPPLIASWPQAELSYWYQAETSAISFNDNCVDLKFQPAAKPGRKPKIILEPDYGYVKVKNRAVTGPPDSPFTLDYRRRADANKVEFFGSIPLGPTRRDYLAVHQPALFAGHTLRTVWKEKGIKVSKVIPWEKARLDNADLIPILQWQSQPLSQLIKVVNTNSQNLYAEQLVKTMGKEASGRGTFSDGLAVVRAFLLENGLTDAQFKLEDGSGLSEENRQTAAGLAALLARMAASPDFPVYYDSMAIPGLDRAAKDRMQGEPLAAGMRLKRGTVAHARNLAGYLHSKSGRLYAFAVLVNGDGLDRAAVDAALDRLCLAAAKSLP